MSDNGIGLSGNGNDASRDSIGMTLIKALVKQLQGTIEINHNCGTKITVRFLNSVDLKTSNASLTALSS